jgi:type II secretory pathway pseudopilin PulG
MKQMRFRPNSVLNSGYSLTEIMVVFAVSMMVLVFAAYFYSGAAQSERLIARTQHLQNLSSRLIALLRKDIRSATGMAYTKDSIDLQVTTISSSGNLEPVEVRYQLNDRGISRSENKIRTDFNFAEILAVDDRWSGSIISPTAQENSYFLELVFVDHSGADLLRLRERLVSPVLPEDVD